MKRARWAGGLVCLTAVGFLVCGGCPDDNPLLSILEDPDVAAGLREAQVFGLLAELAEGDAPDTDAEAIDAEPFFGEDNAAYAVVSAAKVELSEAAILAEAETPDGGPPPRHGKLAGRFISDCPDLNSYECGGAFRGQWFDPNDNVLGVVRGEYYPLPTDQLPEGLTGCGVFRGKIIDNEGRFLGFMRGRYGRGPEGRGLFFGYWVGRYHHRIGVVKGHWDDDPENPGGVFKGRWAFLNICAEVASLPPYAFKSDDFGGIEPTDEVIDVTRLAIAPEPPLDSQPTVFEEPDVRHNLIPPCIDPNLPWGFVRGWHAPYIPVDASDAVTATAVGEELVSSEMESDVASGEFMPHRPGWIRARWRNHQGTVVGILVGHYHPLPPSTDAVSASVEESTVSPVHAGKLYGVWYGKILSLDGTFRAYARGVYGRSHHGLGVFRAHYVGVDGDVLGRAFGRWIICPLRLGGPLFGFWNGKGYEPPDEEPQ